MPVTTTARLRYISIPARKMRLVARLVKGMPIQRALDVLNFTPRAAANPIAKTLKSAAANALSQEGTAHVRPEDLHVKLITVDEAPTAKRIRFQSMGRVFRYRKRYSHLTVVLEEKPTVEAVAPQTAKGKKEDTTVGPELSKLKKSGRRAVAAGKPAKKRPAAKAKKTAPKKAAAPKKTAKKSAKKADREEK